MLKTLSFSFAIFLETLPIFLHSTIFLKEPEKFKSKIEVAACFLEYENEILLLHRQNHTSQGNTWGIPGGKIEKNETALQAIIREVYEETLLDISMQPVTYLGKVYIKYPNYDYIYHMFNCKISYPGDVKISFKEHKGFTWVTPEDALKMNLMLDEDSCIKLIYYENSLIKR